VGHAGHSAASALFEAGFGHGGHGASAGLGTAVEIAAFALFAVGSIALAVVDAREKLLPDRIVFPLYGVGAVGLTLAAWLEHRWAALAVALAAGAALYVIFYGIAMFGPLGFGDVKLAGLLGLYLGWLGIPAVFAGILLGTFAAACVAVGVVVVRRARGLNWRGYELSYGPYLLAGSWAAILLDLVR
jgi:leader peptidase (prepilin peptidase)/N-methyltransferase